MWNTQIYLFYITDDVVVIVVMLLNPTRLKLSRSLSKAPCTTKSGWIKIFSFVFKWNLFLRGGVYNPIYCFILFGIIMTSTRIIGRINKRTFIEFFLSSHAAKLSKIYWNLFKSFFEEEVWELMKSLPSFFREFFFNYSKNFILPFPHFLLSFLISLKVCHPYLQVSKMCSIIKV